MSRIARLHVDQWDAAERIVDWSKTKNSRPHAIPVPLLAAELIESIKPNEHGWIFPSAKDPSKPVSHNTLYSFVWRQRDRGVIPVVTNRDLRRTWKTLAGKAGVSKEIRDRIRNHALHDVSSKSYDRWNYMPEKRARRANHSRNPPSDLIGESSFATLHPWKASYVGPFRSSRKLGGQTLLGSGHERGCPYAD